MEDPAANPSGDWNLSTMALLPKKVGTKEPADYRGVEGCGFARKSVISAIFLQLEAYDRTRFSSIAVKGRQRMDAIATINITLERANEIGAEWCVAWLDINKSHDMFPWSAVVRAARRRKVPESLLALYLGELRRVKMKLKMPNGTESE